MSVPDPPYDLSTSPGNQLIYLNFTPGNTYGYNIQVFVIRYRTPPNTGGWSSFNQGGIFTQYTPVNTFITNLAPSTQYEIQVATTTSQGTSQFSSVLGYTDGYIPPPPPPPPPPATPAPVHNLVAQAIDGGAIALSWSPSTPAPNVSYTIQYKIGGFGGWMTIGTTANNTTTNYTITNMNDYALVNNSTTYCFRVSKTENVTTGPYSNIADAMPFNNNLPMYLWSRFSPNCGSNVSTVTSPSTDNLEQQMLRKASVLRYFKTGSLNFTNSQLWSMAAQNQLTRKKSYATQTQDYTNPNTTNMTNPTQPNIGLKQVNNRLTCWTPQSSVICNSSSASDVPGKPKTLCFSLKAPYNNYKNPKTYGSGGTKLISFY